MGLYRDPKSKNWYVSFSIGGRQIRESARTPNKRLAEELLHKRQTEVFEGRYFPDKRRGDLTVTVLRDLWLEHAKAKRSYKKDVQRFRAVVAFFGPNTAVMTLQPADCVRLRESLKSTITRNGTEMRPATVNRHLALLRSALRWAKNNGYSHRDPMAGVAFLQERNKRDRLCSREEYAKLCKAASPELGLATVLGYETAMRRSEICSLRRSQIDLSAREVSLYADETKTGEPRRIPLSKAAVAAIEAAPRRLDGLVVGLTDNAVTVGFADLCGELGIEGMRFHDLRHTALTRLAKNGAGLAELKKFGGHKSVQALMRYLTATTDDVRAVMDRSDTKPRRSERSR